MNLAWCPMRLRHAFADTDLGARCKTKCAPRIVQVGDMAWIGACAWHQGVGACAPGMLAVLFRLGPVSGLPAAADTLLFGTSSGAVQATLDRSVPLVGLSPKKLIGIDDRKVAEALGATEWRITSVGENEGLVGVAPSGPVALIALSLSAHVRYAKKLAGILRPS